jgi:hypothetical protein
VVVGPALLFMLRPFMLVSDSVYLASEHHSPCLHAMAAAESISTAAMGVRNRIARAGNRVDHRARATALLLGKRYVASTTMLHAVMESSMLPAPGVAAVVVVVPVPT